MKRLLIDHARPLYRRAEKVELREIPDRVSPGIENTQVVEEVPSRLAPLIPASALLSRCESLRD
jgi:hypothetical protein